MAYNPPPYGYPPASNSGGGGSYGDPETVQHGTGQGYVASDPYSQQYGRVDSVAGNDPTAKNIPGGAGGSGGYNFKPGTEAMIVEDRERFNYAQSQYRDFPFVIAFAIHFVLFLVITGYYGSRMSYNTTSTTNTTAFDAGKTISILVVAAVVSVCWSAMFFELMKRYANKIIYFMLVVNAVLCFVGMILAFYSHAYGAGVGYLIIFIFACLMFYCWRHRIPFAHAVLHASALSIQRYSGPIYTAYLLAVISIGWFALWAFTVASVYYQGSANNGNNGLTAGQQLILIYLLFSFYWTSQVLKNVGHTTTAGVVATFYFQPQTDSATWPALKRTVTTSFGSVCLGSLLVALLEMLVYACRSAKGRASRDGNVGLYILACLAECILAQLEAWLRYFNSYAYCQVAIYGVKFMDAAQATIDLFKGRLFDAIINDDLTGLVLSLGCITAGGAACIIAIIWGSIANFDLWSSVAVLAFIVGYAIAMLFFTVIGSAVKTTFVCWAMDPQIFQQNHPELFQNLMVASQAAGYNVQINVNARPGAGQV